MKKFLVLLVAGISLLATTAKTEESEFNVEKCLEKAMSNNEMKQCVFAEYNFQDTKLNNAYKILITKLKADKSEEGKEIKNRVVAAQRAWIAYRDTTCSLEGIDMLNGSGEGLIVGGCLGRVTKERVKFVLEFTKNYTN